MNRTKRVWLLMIMMVCVLLAGCHAAAENPPDEVGTPTQNPSDGSETPELNSSDENVAPTQNPSDEGSTPEQNPGGGDGASGENPSDEGAASGGGQIATLYIGTVTSGFAEYPMAYEGELTPELLIQGIGELTGWNLTLAETVTSGKGGMSVCLADESALFTGPPDPQKEEFHMYDVGQLSQTILDSIQKTLQMGFTGERGNPDALDIYYYMEGERPLELPDLGLSWPIDEPYRWPDAD